MGQFAGAGNRTGRTAGERHQDVESSQEGLLVGGLVAEPGDQVGQTIVRWQLGQSDLPGPGAGWRTVLGMGLPAIEYGFGQAGVCGVILQNQRYSFAEGPMVGER